MSAANSFTRIFNILVSLPIQHTPLIGKFVIGGSFTLSAPGGSYVLKNYPSAIARIDQECPMCAKNVKLMKMAFDFHM